MAEGSVPRVQGETTIVATIIAVANAIETTNIIASMTRVEQRDTTVIVEGEKKWSVLHVDTGVGVEAARGNIGNEAISTTRATISAVEMIRQATKEAKMPAITGIGNERDTMMDERVVIVKRDRMVEEAQIAPILLIEGRTRIEKSITVTIGIGSTDGDRNTGKGRETTDRFPKSNITCTINILADSFSSAVDVRVRCAKIPLFRGHIWMDSHRFGNASRPDGVSQKLCQ